MNAPGSVLVVDDDGDVRALVVELLTRSGYHVSEAPNGREALKLLFEQRPDLVLLDISMPKLDGLELTRRLRDDPDTRALRVVLLTALAQDTDVSEGLAAGADDYVRKPFSPQDLQDRIEALLRTQPGE